MLLDEKGVLDRVHATNVAAVEVAALRGARANTLNEGYGLWNLHVAWSN